MTILQRGIAFGQSRVICGAHWQSDVDAGRLVGSAAVAKLHANADICCPNGSCKSGSCASTSKINWSNC